MADEQKSSDRKKVNPVFFAGPAVAIIAGVSAVFISTSNRDKPPAPAAQEAQPQAAADDPVAQPAQFGQSGPNTAQPPTPPADTISAVSPDGSSVAFSDESLTYSAALPPGPTSDPNLAELRKDAQNYLASKKAEARSQYDEFKKHGGSPAWPWEVKIEWNYTAKAGDIVSLFGTSYEFTGGAHGMTRFDTLIARASGAKLTFDSMLQGGLSPAIIIAMCEALKVEKKKRIDAPTIFDEPIVCAGPNANVKIEKAKLVLAPSSQAGKFGGLYAYYEPYEVGAYAEGSYAITIPQEIFAQDLKPEFKPLFAGDPLPPKD
ncbi:MAG: DUF4163 domain-containing protein [Hyphomonadaceae bacterium]